MRRLLGILAALALVAMLVFVAMTIDLSRNGAYVNGSVERFPGAETVAQAGSLVTVLGPLLLLIATILGVILAVQQRQWGWLLLIVALLPVAVISMLAVGFQPDVKIAALTLLSPLVLAYYDMRGQAASDRANAA